MTEQYEVSDNILDQERELTIYLTGQCNSNCIMCPESDHQRLNDNGPGAGSIFRQIDRLPDNATNIVVTGGEPTLETELFFEVMARLKERFNYSDILLLTNGRSFAAKTMVERLYQSCPDYLTIAIPIHGPNADIHDGISRTKGSFRQTCMGIENLHAHSAAIELRVVVSRLNCNHLVETARLIAERFPYVQIVNFIGLETMGNCAKYLRDVYIDYDEAFKAIKPAAETLIEAGVDVSLYNFPYCTVEQGFWSLCRNSISPYKIRYSDICEGCDVRERCGGVFRSTLALAKPRLTPIHFSLNTNEAVI